MSLPKIIMTDLLNPKVYLWIDVILIKETPKAILIEFDGKKTWLPKAWVVKIKSNRHCERSEAISIKISEYHWAKKFQVLKYNLLIYKIKRRHVI